MKIIYNQVTWYSKTLAIILAILTFALGFYLGKEIQIEKKKLAGFVSSPQELINIENNNQQLEKIDMCYIYKGDKYMDSYDKAILRMYIVGNNVSGEYKNLPAYKDSKTGQFTGTVSALDQQKMGRTAYLLWDSFAEGMNAKEELMIEFGDGSAVALFGEMIEQGNGIYNYKDKNKLTPGFLMSQIDCANLDEITLIENYVREHIQKIATNQEVLGGSWYVVSVDVNYSLNEGEVIYEDGHIQSEASFKYSFDNTNGNINILDFSIKK